MHTDRLDAQLYVLDKARVSALLDDKPRMTSLQLDVIPALVRRQFKHSRGPKGQFSETVDTPRNLT